MRYSAKEGVDRLIRVDYHGSKMEDHLALLRERGMSVPTPTPHPTIIIENEERAPLV